MKKIIVLDKTDQNGDTLTFDRDGSYVQVTVDKGVSGAQEWLYLKPVQVAALAALLPQLNGEPAVPQPGNGITVE